MSISRDQVLDLYATNLSSIEVAAILKINASAVRNIVRRAQDSNDPRAAPRKLMSDVNAALFAEAKRRGVTVKELRDTIISIVVRDGLFTAVLDQ